MIYTDILGLGVKLSNMGFGCLQLGGHGWGRVSEPEIIKAIHEAIDSGITLFDTAPIYGLGHSEEVLGKTLINKRDKIILATKVGLAWKKTDKFVKFCDSSPANIEREIDASLKRLKTECIDLYQIHWPDCNTPIEYAMDALGRLKRAGKIRCVGCCNFSLNLLREALKCGEVKSLQIPYNLIDRKVEKDMFLFCKENGIAVLVYSPLAKGLFSGKYDNLAVFPQDDHRSRADDEYFSTNNMPASLKVLEKVKTVAGRLNRLPAQVALRWVLENPNVTTTIFGATTVQQVKENIAASDFAISKEDIEFLSGS